MAAAMAAGIVALSLPRLVRAQWKGEWTPWFSDEGWGKGTCNGLVSGFECGGRYCDNLRLACHFGWDYAAGEDWGSWFSEESGGRTCPGGRYVTGLQCKGRYCDDMRLRCNVVDRLHESNCRWISWWSDENGQLRYPEGSYLKGMRCSGRYCDNVQAYVCDADQPCSVDTKPLGFWQHLLVLPGVGDKVKFTVGSSKSHAESRTQQWSQSMSLSVSRGFNIGVPGIAEASANIELSFTSGVSEVQSYKSAWTRNEGTEVEFTFPSQDRGRLLWQFHFTATDSCGHRETFPVREIAVTPGAWQKPCCRPKWSTDAPYYTTCKDADSLIFQNESYCKVESRSPVRHCGDIKSRAACCHYLDTRSAFDNEPCVPAREGEVFHGGHVCEPACYLAGWCPSGYGLGQQDKVGTCSGGVATANVGEFERVAADGQPEEAPGPSRAAPAEASVVPNSTLAPLFP